MKTLVKTTRKTINRATGRRTQKTVVVLPLELAAEIDGRVGTRNRQKFVIENCLKELRRLDQLEAIRQATGAWKHEDHPEFAKNSTAWQERMRRQWDGR